ncbi:MAG TPA: S41 family peptidase [Chloroflexota bacterium]
MSGRRGGLFLGLAIGAILSVIFVAGFVAGAAVQERRTPGTVDASDPNVKEFLYAYHLVTQRSYFRPFDKQHLVYAAIDGMLAATGDPHTMFLSPPENQAAVHELNGSNFSGIGAIVVPSRGDLEVVAPLPHTPAADAGLKANDMVTKIGGVPVSRMSGDGAIARIHGPTGSYVVLTVVRGHGKPFVVRVRRAQIPAITAYGRMLPHDLGYIQVLSFGDTTSSEVAAAVSQLASHPLRGIVLDLRGNPGGYVDAAQGVVSQFLTHGTVAYEETSNHQLQPLDVIPSKQAPHVPLAVLVDADSASAAEITAAALRDNRRAEIIGTRTYGKGSMQSVYTLSDGSSIRITDRLWLTPLKKSIQKVGIHPDIYVSESGASANGTDDPQLTAAEQYLLQRQL